MDLALDDTQETLVATFAELLAKHSSTQRVRAAEPLGFDAVLWDVLQGVGVVDMSVPSSVGDTGARVFELALVAEQLGVTLASAPVIEAQVAARLCRDLGASTCDELCTLAIRPASAGTATLVPAGAVADRAVIRDDDRLLLTTIDERNRRCVTNLASSPLADVTVGQDAVELAHGDEASTAFETAIDEWLVLTASALVGVAAAAHRMTCAYARERETWGVPIGAYQAVAHPLADSATAIDGARLLSYAASCAHDRRSERARELSAMAFAFASETARDATYRAVHFHGGYGFTLEHDAQLYYRRARGWARVWGEPNDAYRRAACARRRSEVR
jgi:alkylation response protein AidB-like acyl-CoA dehydrogenase